MVPALALVLGYIYFGIVYNGAASLYRWNGISPTRTWVGFQNFTDLVSDDVFVDAVKHTVYFGFITITVQGLLGYSLAWLVNKRIAWRGAYKAVFFAPVVMAPAVIAPVARQMLAPDGQINWLFNHLGLHALSHAWLADPDTSLYALMAVNIWEWTGFSFVLYYAALCQIDGEIYDAARVDGASDWRTMWRIAWPLCKPTTFTLVILGAISSLKVFDLVYLITGGGPAGSSEVISTYVYRQSVLQFHAGYGAAMSMAMLGIAMVLTVIQLRVYGRRGQET